MRLRAMVWVPLLLWLWSPAHADPILYTFAGSGDAQLAGGFLLDDSAPWLVSTEGEGATAVLLSPVLHL